MVPTESIRDIERSMTPEQRRVARAKRKLERVAKKAAKAASPKAAPKPRHSSGYQERVQSPEWRVFKMGILSKRGPTCEGCASTRRRVDLHHLHYRTLGKERECDVILLCRRCHDERHGLTLPSTRRRLSKRRTADATQNLPSVGTGLRAGTSTA